jgi:hypothetical protein
MKVLLIGTVVKDNIIFTDKTKVESFGGLTHSINAALALCNADDHLIPVSRIGVGIRAEFLQLWPNDVRLIKDGLIPWNQNNNCVELTCLDSNERIEKSLYPMPPLQFEEVEPYLDADLILVNLISGWDVELSFMQKLRASFNGLIALDIHSLTLERLPDGTRRLKPVSSIQPWLDTADIIQLNEREFEMIAGGEKDPEVFFKQTCAQTEKIINLTKGEHGSESYRIKNNHCEVIRINAHKELKVIDPIGCGDTFFAVYGISYFRTKDVKLSVFFANTAAALAGSIKGLANSAILQEKLSLYAREDM